MLEHAEFYFAEGYRHQVAGRLDAAILMYQKSIAAQPTAEAHTFLGWTYSFQQRVDEAIAECRRAIEIDPDFGNPYNDIGAYLIEQGKLAEAIPWFEKARLAPRYEPRHYPCFNLARVYMAQGRWSEAEEELEEALRLNPDYELARRALARLRERRESARGS